MAVVSRLSALLAYVVRRSKSVYLSSSALATLVQLSLLGPPLYSNVYPSFAADGRIFRPETLAHSLGGSCVEKEYLIALVDIGRAVSIAKTSPWKMYDDEARAELLDTIYLQQYVPSIP